MTKQYTLVINAGNKDTAKTVNIPSNRKNPLLIKAEAGNKYLIQDPQKGNKAPETVKIKRVGKDLQVMFDDAEQADLIIENYYEVMPEGFNGLIGEAENGFFYEYLPEDPSQSGLLSSLQDGSEAVYVLIHRPN